jgi:hypothetical protein
MLEIQNSEFRILNSELRNQACSSRFLGNDRPSLRLAYRALVPGPLERFRVGFEGSRQHHGAAPDDIHIDAIRHQPHPTLDFGGVAA